jgi:hypothetical protein
VDHFLDRARAEEQRLGDRRVVLPLCHLAQHVQLPRRQLVERRLLGAGLVGHEGLDHARVDHGAAGRHGLDRRDDVVDVPTRP